MRRSGPARTSPHARGRWRHRLGRAGSAAILLAASSPWLTSCAVRDDADAAGSTADDDTLDDAELVLRFDEVAVPGDAVPDATNDGTVTTRSTVATRSGGRLTWADGWDGGGIRTPVFGTAANTPTAALVLWPVGTGRLDPRDRDFTAGVDFLTESIERGRPGDDGDNLVQRGRFDDQSQIKLQLDHGIPSCRLSGSAGAVVVSAGRPVVAGRWYRLVCTRAAGRVVLALTDLGAGGGPSSWDKASDPGDIHFGTVPVSVGAKVTQDGDIDVDGTDQFHGVIDRVFVDVS